MIARRRRSKMSQDGSTRAEYRNLKIDSLECRGPLERCPIRVIQSAC